MVLQPRLVRAEHVRERERPEARERGCRVEAPQFGDNIFVEVVRRYDATARRAGVAFGDKRMLERVGESALCVVRVRAGVRVLG